MISLDFVRAGVCVRVHSQWNPLKIWRCRNISLGVLDNDALSPKTCLIEDDNEVFGGNRALFAAEDLHFVSELSKLVHAFTSDYYIIGFSRWDISNNVYEMVY